MGHLLPVGFQNVSLSERSAALLIERAKCGRPFTFRPSHSGGERNGGTSNSASSGSSAPHAKLFSAIFGRGMHTSQYTYFVLWLMLSRRNGTEQGIQVEPQCLRIRIAPQNPTATPAHLFTVHIGKVMEQIRSIFGRSLLRQFRKMERRNRKKNLNFYLSVVLAALVMKCTISSDARQCYAADVYFRWITWSVYNRDRHKGRQTDRQTDRPTQTNR
jgi:hypothetical protein